MLRPQAVFQRVWVSCMVLLGTIRIYCFLPSPYRFRRAFEKLNGRTDPIVNKATQPRITASLVQGCPISRLAATRTRVVLIHSMLPRTRTACVSRATQGRGSRRRAGKSAMPRARNSRPAREKCAASRSALISTGRSFKTVIVLLIVNATLGGFALAA